LCIISYVVGGAFLGLAYFDLPYHLMTICALCYTFIQKELNKREIPSVNTTKAFGNVR